MTITIEHQKLTSLKVLQALKLIDNGALIAGGAPRNWDEGKLANDIDCYLRWNISTTGSVLDALELLLNDEVLQESNVDCSYHFGDDSFHLSKLISFRYDGVLFQLVIIGEDKKIPNFSQTILGHMDIGLNMIGCNWWNRADMEYYIKTKQYQQDRDNKTLTLYQNVMNPEQLQHCMTRHLPKMMSYYPDYKLTISGVV